MEMTDALTEFPDALAHEYSGLRLVRRTPCAFVYRADDGLDEPVLITEIFHEESCQRDHSGIVSAQPDSQERWSSALAVMQEKVAVWSRLVHPALCGIDQVFHTNGTLYVVTRDFGGQPLDRLLPGISTTLEPRHLVSAAERLIDLQSYLHAFGVRGLPITPAVLTLEDQDATVSFALQRHIDGTIEASSGDGGEVGAEARDCDALARTLHSVLTGAPPAQPYKPLTGRVKSMPGAFLATLDDRLANPQKIKPKTAREWKTQAASAKTRYRSVPAWLPMAAGAALLSAGLFAWFGLPTNTDTIDAPPVFQSEDAIPGAGPWRLELPLRVAHADAPETGFVLKLAAASSEFLALNPWAQDGQKVAELNGAPITEVVDLRALAISAEPSAGTPQLISLKVSDPELPLQRDVAVIPYLWREKTYGAVRVREQFANSGWQLRVSAIADGEALPLRAGDLLIGEQVTGLALERLSQLEGLLSRLEGAINPSLTLMIRREPDQRLVVGFAIQKMIGQRSESQDQ